MLVYFGIQSPNPDCTCGEAICDSCSARGFCVSVKDAKTLLVGLGLKDLRGETSCHDMSKRAKALSERATPQDVFLKAATSDLITLCDMAGDLGRISWG
jgi:hypothetical protein